jgi:hypothetical protein
VNISTMKTQRNETSTGKSDNPVKTSLDRNGMLLENTSQQLTDHVAQALAARRHRHLELLEISHETDRTPEMRQEDSESRLRLARKLADPNLNVDALKSELRDAALRRSQKISDIIKDRIRRRVEGIEATERTKWIDLLIVPPVDHSFWWAQTQPYVAPDTRADFRNDGLHFWGGPKVNDYDGDMHTTFGAVALFALQPERFPTSPSGVFLSSPHVELFGGIVAYAPDWDLISGRRHCRMQAVPQADDLPVAFRAGRSHRRDDRRGQRTRPLVCLSEEHRLLAQCGACRVSNRFRQSLTIRVRSPRTNFSWR